ncbi:Autophagy-protein 20 [Rhizopus stolonifer]|uniref:Autophagy-protein 20 n=1 Tax=Rhizopus stolonifer TaxID=4846 RepID=A0A367KKB9_RHIST|nr:Autophagy-protein 20 [Rhizopus stolonifer]
MFKTSACQCTIQKWIEEQELVVKIIYAEKSQTDNHSFIVYTIQTQDMKEIKRRYSEFESLRKSLVRLYPVLLVPPIPEKHSITEYTRKDENIGVINKRKRMLERFLVRISDHPILRQEHVFHRFIHGNESWNDILTSAPLSDLPKDPLLPGVTLSQPNSVIPIPPSSYILKIPHPAFERAEINVNKTMQDKGIKLDRSQKNILKRLTDLSNDYTELGSVYNALSLYEPSGVLSGFIEKLGQVVDDSCSSTHEMIRDLEIECAEHIQDYSQYIQITQQALRYRHMKQAQVELIQDTLDQRHVVLDSLVRKQDESNKLKSELDSLSITPQELKEDEEDDFLDTESIEDGFAAVIKEDIKKSEEEYDYPASATLSTVRSSKEHIKKWSSTKKLFSAFSFTFQGMIDSDPEQTRQNQIMKTRETIRQLENAKQSTSQELVDMSSLLEEELKRLEDQQNKELKSILVSFAKIHLAYCERNMMCWKKIRNEVNELNQ